MIKPAKGPLLISILLVILIPFFWIESVTLLSGESKILPLSFALCSLFSGLIFKSYHKTKKSIDFQVYGVILMSLGLLMMLLLGWNELFVRFSARESFQSDIFRGVFNNARAPFYSMIHLELPSIKRILPMFLLSLVYFVFIAWNIDKLDKKWFFVSASFLVLAMCSFAMSDGFMERLLSNGVYYEVFNEGAMKYENISDVFASYTLKMNDLALIHHYPPGNVFLFKIEQFYIPHFAKAFVFFSSVLAIVPMVGIMKLFKAEMPVINLAVIFYVISGGVIIFPSFALTSITIAPSLFMVYFLLNYLQGRNKWNILYLSITVVVFMMFSYAFAVPGLILAVLLFYYLFKNLASLKDIILIPLMVISLVVFMHWLFFLITGFNQWDCFINSLKNNTAEMSFGYDNAWRYLFRSTGNMLAYLGSVGIPIVALSIWRIKGEVGQKMDVQIMKRSIWITLLLASFSGLFFLETARIWIFFTPFLCMLAAFNLEKYMKKEHYWTILVIIAITLSISIQEEIFVDHAFGHFGSGW